MHHYATQKVSENLARCFICLVAPPKLHAHHTVCNRGHDTAEVWNEPPVEGSQPMKSIGQV
ncbi:hypothetical protein Syun_021751 [Stephania yunnanensis]|uniref:Uncharacterized protein n=1 Tax=Stephania yunnanensis TaxID=152371 RepID=A0AAP0NQY7_9MAGN